MSESEHEVKTNGPTWMQSVGRRLEEAADSAVPDEACRVLSAERCEKDKAKIHDHISKMSEYAGHHLDSLKDDLEKADKPTWTKALLEKVLDVSLATGGTFVGEFIAERFLSHEAKALSEFLKKSFEEAAPGGTQAALQALRGNDQPEPKKFIESQKDGVTALYENAADRFIDTGQDQVLTKKQAARLLESLSVERSTMAAYGHYRASRDAYLTCLAKQTLGTRADGLTDMSSQREHEAKGSKGHAPDLVLAMTGIDRGVLSVQVMLHDDVRRQPHVLGSILNGVNDTIRAQYEHVPLSSANVPRQLKCVVRGGTDFMLNVDEAGNVSVVSGSGEWLEARAREGTDDVTRMTLADQQRIGAQLLLEDIEIEEIGKGGS